MMKSAILSPDKLYRYTLTRIWEDKPTYAFIGLNPSTADHEKDDATIKKCVNFVKAWGGGGLLMLNLFAWRATKPTDMLKERKLGKNIVGPMNTKQDILEYIQGMNCLFVVAAWGTHSNKYLREYILERGYEVSRHLRNSGVEMKYLNANKDGTPQHPLYIPLSMALHQWGTYAVQDKTAVESVSQAAKGV